MLTIDLNAEATAPAAVTYRNPTLSTKHLVTTPLGTGITSLKRVPSKPQTVSNIYQPQKRVTTREAERKRTEKIAQAASNRTSAASKLTPNRLHMQQSRVTQLTQAKRKELLSVDKEPKMSATQFFNFMQPGGKTRVIAAATSGH